MYLKKECNVCAIRESWKMLMIMMKMACYFWQQQHQKRKAVNHRWKKGRKGRREGREEGRKTDLNKQVMVQK